MLAAIGLDRSGVQITNVIYWRPPGNRKPTAAEIAACLPFVLRHIALVAAQGAGAGRRHRGQRIVAAEPRASPGCAAAGSTSRSPASTQPVPTLPMFHPSFLLRTPERKREAWRDLLALKAAAATTLVTSSDRHAGVTPMPLDHDPPVSRRQHRAA